MSHENQYPDYRRVLTDEEVSQLMARTEKRQRDAREALGQKWICHPYNAVRRKEDKRWM